MSEFAAYHRAKLDERTRLVSNPLTKLGRNLSEAALLLENLNVLVEDKEDSERARLARAFVRPHFLALETELSAILRSAALKDPELMATQSLTEARAAETRKVRWLAGRTRRIEEQKDVLPPPLLMAAE